MRDLNKINRVIRKSRGLNLVESTGQILSDCDRYRVLPDEAPKAQSPKKKAGNKKRNEPPLKVWFVDPKDL